MTDKLKQAIEVLKKHRYEHLFSTGTLGKAIDTVLQQLEKPLPSDDQVGCMALAEYSKHEHIQWNSYSAGFEDEIKLMRGEGKMKAEDTRLTEAKRAMFDDKGEFRSSFQKGFNFALGYTVGNSHHSSSVMDLDIKSVGHSKNNLEI